MEDLRDLKKTADVKRKTVDCKVIIQSQSAEITPDTILTLEHLLNSSLASQIWASIALGVRFHITMEE